MLNWFFWITNIINKCKNYFLNYEISKKNKFNCYGGLGTLY